MRNSVPFRRIYPDEDGYLIFHKSSKRYRFKASKVAYELGTASELAADQQLLHRNLDPDDYRLRNLLPLPRAVFKQVKEAHANLEGSLKLQPHGNDLFCYRLVYREGGKEKTCVMQDIVLAKQKFMALQLKFAKLLNRYCLFD